MVTNATTLASNPKPTRPGDSGLIPIYIPQKGNEIQRRAREGILPREVKFHLDLFIYRTSTSSYIGRLIIALVHMPWSDARTTHVVAN